MPVLVLVIDLVFVYNRGYPGKIIFKGENEMSHENKILILTVLLSIITGALIVLVAIGVTAGYISPLGFLGYIFLFILFSYTILNGIAIISKRL